MSWNKGDSETLYQRQVPHIYLMKPYSIYFVHDFNQYDTLESQLPAVRKKYKRRVGNFYKDIIEPTLFVYYLYDQEDANWIVNNYDYIISVLKSYNENNNIIYISDCHVSFSKNCFYVDNDKDSDIAFDFVHQNNDLMLFFNHLPFSSSQNKRNLKHFKISTRRKKIKNKFKRVMNIFCPAPQKTEYHHYLTDFS